MTILDKIVSFKKEEVLFRKKDKPLPLLQADIKSSKNIKSLLNSLKSDSHFHFICEIKKASPSEGVIQPNFHPLQQATSYQVGGASAISVLTDEHFFMGHLNHLKLVSTHIDIPILRKDFIIDSYQIYETKAVGADIILFIAKLLSYQQLEEFSALAFELGLDVLIEIHEASELEKISNFENVILGINNRNLDTFKLDLKRSIDIKSKLQIEIPVISESGIKRIDDCLMLAENGFRGVLIGDVLMRSANPKVLIKKWKQKISHGNTT